jgi:hypothetical protein
MGILSRTWGDLHRLAGHCLERLSGVGLSEGLGSTKASRKQKRGTGQVIADPARARAVRLDNGQVMWLKVEPQRKGPDQEYKRIEVYDQPLQTDVAIVGAVAASESDPVVPEDFREGRAALLYKYFSQVPVSETPTYSPWPK